MPSTSQHLCRNFFCDNEDHLRINGHQMFQPENPQLAHRQAAPSTEVSLFTQHLSWLAARCCKPCSPAQNGSLAHLFKRKSRGHGAPARQLVLSDGTESNLGTPNIQLSMVVRVVCPLTSTGKKIGVLISSFEIFLFFQLCQPETDRSLRYTDLGGDFSLRISLR